MKIKFKIWAFSISLWFFMGLTNNTGMLYSQTNDENQIIKSLFIFKEDSLVQIPIEDIVIIPDNSERIIFHLDNKDSVLYCFSKSPNHDTLWSVLKQEKLELNYLNPGEYTFSVKSFHNSSINDLHIIVKNLFLRRWKFHLIFAIVAFILAYLLYLYRSWKVIQDNKSYKIKEITSLEVARQKEELSIKNKNITDSINYARRIQLAMIPSGRYFNTIFPESFIYFKPKDIVSGDFFWITEKKDKVFFAAVDCTGHGVPGAFMSIIGIELLRKLVINQKIEEPSEILNELNKNFAEIFKDVENITLRDGMDIAFCTIDKGSRILEFAGAFNPLYLIRDNKITEIKGDRFSVGLEDYENFAQSFTNHHIQLHKNDMIYIFTDGYSDQFGGPEGKKFKYRRFRHLLLTIHNLPVKGQQEHLERSIEEWKGDNDQVDDILIIGIKVNF